VIDTSAVRIRQATTDDSVSLARLRYTWATESDPSISNARAFEQGLTSWMRANQRTHTAYLAEFDREPIGMAWLAIAERVPEPAALSRRTGDLQSMYVLPAHRGQGVGTRLIQSVITAAATFGLEALSVRAGRRSLPLYKRLGFTTSDHVHELIPHDRGVH